MSNIKVSLPAIVAELGIKSKVDSLNKLLNQKPPSQWLKVHNGVNYQPIERVKNNLTILFQEYDWSIKGIQIVANSILVYGSLSVINPVTGNKRTVDGVGAWPIQLKAGSNPTDFSQITTGAIQKNAPAAESLALKNAAAKLGRFFSDGKEDVEDFKGIYSVEIPDDDLQAMKGAQS